MCDGVEEQHPQHLAAIIAIAVVNVRETRNTTPARHVKKQIPTKPKRLSTMRAASTDVSEASYHMLSSSKANEVLNTMMQLSVRGQKAPNALLQNVEQQFPHLRGQHRHVFLLFVMLKTVARRVIHVITDTIIERKAKS